MSRGFDLWVISRFSHLVDRFIFIDDCSPLRVAINGPRDLVERLRSEVEVIPGLEVTRHEVDSLDWPRCEYAARLHLVRRIGTSSRTVELVYVKGDAGAIFDHAWRQARVAPAIVVDNPELRGTHPRAPFPARFHEIGRHPRVWLLDYHPFHRRPDPVYAPAGHRPDRIQGFVDRPWLRRAGGRSGVGLCGRSARARR